MTEFTLGLTQLLGHGHAFSEVVPVTSPAAGAGFTYKNTGLYWELVDSLSFSMVTGSNAANRLTTLTVKHADGTPLATVPSAAALTASKTGYYTYLQNYSATTGATDGPFLNTFPAIFLQPDWTVNVAVGNIDAADQISGIYLNVQRFVTGKAGYLLGVVDVDDPAMLERIAWHDVTR